MQLNYQDLKKYMTIVYELEEEICFQNELMAKLQQKISSLGISRNINPPKKPPTKKITIPIFLSAPIAILAGIGLVISLISFVQIFWEFDLKHMFAGWIALVIFCYIAGWALEQWDKTSKYNSQYKREMDKYNRDLEHYQEEIRKNKYNQQNEEKLKNKLIKNLMGLQAVNKGTKECLVRFYNMEIIMPKYRNLIAVSSFKDYLDEGRCYELSGHEGAYNLYNIEARLDKIVTQLDAVISNLSEIKYNQYSLYQAVKESGERTNLYYRQWVRSTNDFVDSYNNNTNITNYRLQRMNKELEYQNKLLRSRYSYL